MGRIDLGGRSREEYKAWLRSPEGQRAAQAENARVQAQGGYRVSSDGVVQPPPGWAQGQSKGPPAGYGGDLAAFRSPEAARRDGYFGPLTQIGGQFVADEALLARRVPRPAAIRPAAPQPSGLLAPDAPWWAGEFYDLPHDPSDHRPAYVNGRPTGANADNYGGGAKSGQQPGAAQPKQPPSQGTPYGARPTLRPPGQSFAGDPRGGFAAVEPGQRPPPFQSTVASSPFGEEDPFGNRHSFVAQMQQQNKQRQQMFNSGGFSPPASWGQNPFYGSLSPFSGGPERPGLATPVQPPSQGTPYGGRPYTAQLQAGGAAQQPRRAGQNTTGIWRPRQQSPFGSGGIR